MSVYEKEMGRTITVEEVSGALEGVTNNGNINDEIADYVKWYMSNTGKHDFYRSDLQGVLVDYLQNNPDCKYKNVDSLSLEQIDELNKKLNTPDYNLNLE